MFELGSLATHFVTFYKNANKILTKWKENDTQHWNGLHWKVKCMWLISNETDGIKAT